MRIMVSYRGIPASRGWETGASVVRALHSLGYTDSDAYEYGNVYQTADRIDPIWTRGKKPECDLLIWMECNDSDPQYTELFELRCRKVLWDFDTAMHLDMTKALAKHFDHVFLANRRYLDQIPGSHYLPYAFDQGLVRPAAGPKRGAAIIGTPFPERVAFAKAAGVELVTGVFRQEYVDAVARLLVHVHHHDSGGDGLLVGRIWETMGIGTCLLAQDNEELTRTIGSGYVTYVSPEDCREGVRWLLEHPEIAEERGQQGRSVMLGKHTYRHRVREMLKVIGVA